MKAKRSFAVDRQFDELMADMKMRIEAIKATGIDPGAAREAEHLAHVHRIKPAGLCSKGTEETITWCNMVVEWHDDLETEGEREATCPHCLRLQQEEERLQLVEDAVGRLSNDDLRRIIAAGPERLTAALALLTE
jgi:hypothetical protein